MQASLFDEPGPDDGMSERADKLLDAQPDTPADVLPGKPPANTLIDPLDLQFDRVPAGWRAVTERFRASPAGRSLIDAVDARRAAGATIYPRDVFRALHLTPLDAVRVVILGQDPYHGPGQAEGLAFSVPAGVAWPPSLRNIFKERDRDVGGDGPGAASAKAAPHGSLQAWARQGVLLLNTSLTVEDGQAASHARLGWEALTDALIDAVAARTEPAVFMLWGAHAQRKCDRIRECVRPLGFEHWVLEANHPSPLSATRGPQPFIGCSHFSVANAFGRAHGWQVDWS